MELSNKYFRKHIKLIHDLAKNITQTNVRDENTFNFIVFSGIHKIDIGYETIPILKLHSEEQKNQSFIMQGFMESVMIMDLYLALNKKICLGESTKKDESIINRIISCVNNDKTDKKYDNLFIDPNVDAMLVQSSLDFLDLTAFDKVLTFKCLTEDDATVLNAISPLFMQDLITYAVDINRDFFIRQINKLKKAFGEEEAMNIAAKFLIGAFKMDIQAEELIIDIRNHAGTDEVMQGLVDENIQLVSAFVLSYYKEYNQEGPKLS